MERVAAPHARLEEVLRALPAKELASIVSRLGIRIDDGKRLDMPAQVARGLVQLPDLRDTSRLPAASVALLHRVAEAKGTLIVSSLPPSLEPLLARGIMFARSIEGLREGGIELVLPVAHMLQLRSWEGEDPKGLRALIAQASFETTSAIAAHYLGRPATPPIALSLESAWEVLSNGEALQAEVEKLAPTERRVLEKVDGEGGEVDTEELLELEREPLRLRTATGVTPSRRGVGSALERRGFLIPVHPNRHVVPTEIARIVGAQRHAERASQREDVKRFVVGGDHAPRRARFAHDPGPLGLALALASREAATEVRPNIGTPKSLIHRMASRFGRDPAHVAMFVALSRATGLWDASALGTTSPPGSLAIHDLPTLLFSAWRRGGAWDEGRDEPEMLRLAEHARDPSPVGVVRDMVTDALVDLGDGWIPWAALAGYLRSDERTTALRRLFRRWSERVSAPATDPMAVARRIVMESLPALGILDLGEDDGLVLPDSPIATNVDEADRPVALRLTPRGRALLATKPLSLDTTPSKFLDSHVLRIGAQARVAAVLGIAQLVEVTRVAETVDLLVSPQTLARALAAGLEADILRQRIEAVAPLPETLSRTLAQASVVVGRGTFVHSSGFLWVDDVNIRELLRTRRATAELFLDPSPPAGLLLAPGVDVDRLSRRCRTVGVDVLFEGQVVRARSLPPGAHSTPPPSRTSPMPPRVSTPPPRRRSSQMKGVKGSE